MKQLSTNRSLITINFFKTEDTITEQVEIIGLRIQKEISLLKNIIQYTNKIFKKYLKETNNNPKIISFYDIIQNYDHQWIKDSLLTAFISIRGEIYNQISVKHEDFDLRRFFEIIQDNKENDALRLYEKILADNKHLLTINKYLPIIDDLHNEFINIYNNLTHSLKDSILVNIDIDEFITTFYKIIYVDLSKMLGILIRFISHFELILRLYISCGERTEEFNRTLSIMKNMGFSNMMSPLEFLLSFIIYTIEYKE